MIHAFLPVGACISNPVMGFALAICGSSLCNNTRLYLLLEGIFIEVLEECLQVLLLLLATRTKSIEEPLQPCSFLYRRMLKRISYVLHNHIGITGGSQEISRLFHTLIGLLKWLFLTGWLIRIHSGAETARGDAHFMHCFNILIFEHLVAPIQELLCPLGQFIASRLCECLVAFMFLRYLLGQCRDFSYP